MLDWKDGQPFSDRFGDVYFSNDSGLEETHHVFLQGNRLAERFAVLTPGERFCIGETGFGTGLNFLCAWQLFVQDAPECAVPRRAQRRWWARSNRVRIAAWHTARASCLLRASRVK
jgi:tRNA U34 5-methylaminomethyl-2-thiouridine-forming methyltransferase MnmC